MIRAAIAALGHIAAHMFGDCRCGHSFAYHMPFAGCMKCSCDEFR